MQILHNPCYADIFLCHVPQLCVHILLLLNVRL